MWLERESMTGRILLLRNFYCSIQHRLMTAMNTIKIADRDNAAACGIR